MSSSSSVAPVIAAPKPKRALKRLSATPKRVGGFKRAQLRRMAVRAHCTGITRKFTPQLGDYLTRVTTALVKTAIILAGDKKTLQVRLILQWQNRSLVTERILPSWLTWFFRPGTWLRPLSACLPRNNCAAVLLFNSSINPNLATSTCKRLERPSTPPGTNPGWTRTPPAVS